MKKVILSLIVVLSVMGLAGCRVVYDTNDRLDNETTIIDEEIPSPAADNNGNDDYMTSIRQIDTRLYNQMDNLDGIAYNEDDDDYIVKRTDYYNQSASAYRRALDDMNGLNVTDEYKDSHEAMMDYYQNGYDLYNGLYTKYNGFETIDDELRYRNQVGDNGYHVRTDYQNAYDRVIKDLRIRG